jgi:hypothetical protein
VSEKKLLRDTQRTNLAVFICEKLGSDCFRNFFSTFSRGKEKVLFGGKRGSFEADETPLSEIGEGEKKLLKGLLSVNGH